MTQEDKALVDRYLENSLTGIDLKNFIDRLESDENFKKEVSFQRILIEGIQYSETRRQILVVKNSISYRKALVPLALKLIFTFLFITLGGIVVWNFFDPDTSGRKSNSFSFDFFHKQKDSTLTESKDFELKKNKKTVLTPLIIYPEEKKNQAQPQLRDDTLAKTDTTDIIVKKDQLLISVTMKAIEIDKPNTTEERSTASIQKSTVDKLNPAAGLPENKEGKSNFYIVEFWVSPVNYKGYKLVDEKLILFGIEEPDAVQLISEKNKLMMKYGEDYYNLLPTDEFQSLAKVNESVAH